MRWCFVVALIYYTFALIKTNGVYAVSIGPVTVAVSASVPGTSTATLALRNITALVLQGAGVRPVAVDTHSCDVSDSSQCLISTIRALSDGTNTTVALVTISASITPPTWVLSRESGVQELGDVTEPSRRACFATSLPARSLLDLANASIAATYHVNEEDINRVLNCNQQSCYPKLAPEWCQDEMCAAIFTSVQSEAKVLFDEIQKHHLYAVIRPLDEHLSTVTSYFAKRPIIACDWAPELSLAEIPGEILGPPPCLSTYCPFETRRIVLFINIRELASAQSAIEALARLNISKTDMKTLIKEAVKKDPEQAARDYIKSHPLPAPRIELRIALLVPKHTSREVYNTLDLQAAAAFAEEIANEREREPDLPGFKVQIVDDRCHTQGAYKYLLDAPGAEFGTLSALAGPACGMAWTDVAKQSGVHNLPIFAYTLQAPASTSLGNSDARLQLLAAGDARDAALALAAFISKMGWRRVAALSEPSTRPLLDAVRMKAKIIVYTEIPENGSNIGADIIQHWASTAADEQTKILYLCVEDARIARAALCAARAKGLTPHTGTVWLLCNTHKQGWLEAKPGDNCTTEQLEEEAQGHIFVTPEWALSWRKESNHSEQRIEWEHFWRIHCNRMALSYDLDQCNFSPGPTAALLFDTVLQWAASLYHLVKSNQAAVYDLHNIGYVRSLINDTVTTNFTGLTGSFNWITVDGAYSRNGSFVLLQWDSKTGEYQVGTWDHTYLIDRVLVLDRVALKWYTEDGRLPDDGSEKCALQGLADALNADCRIAFIALGAILIVLLVVVMAVVAYYCKRRTENEYRKRLQALGMRPLAIKPAGLDRWEIPRERVVINRKLGTGAFGTVYGGHALLAEDKGWSAVAVKTLKAGASTEEKLDFLSEAEAMKRFDHKNVVRLLGVVTKTEPVCTVMEFMLYGDLKNYLLARRHLAMGGNCEESEGMEADEASPIRLTGMALDVARALSYLANSRYVHRDVAARNCLVSARRVVKLADFGMTRLVFENDYYRFSRKGMLPVRWMAPESLALGVFSPASDVWSFGVLLYEIVTFGSLPFQGLSNSEVLTKVKGGHTLDLPAGLKPQLEGLIKSCWQQDPKKRPTASEVAAYLADAPRLLSPCLDVPLDALPLDADPPWRLPRDQAEARWVSWAAPASAGTDTTYLSVDGAVPLDTDSFLP